MPKSDAQRRAENKYAAANYTMIGCKVRKDYAERIKAAAAAMNTTPGAVVRAALDKLLCDFDGIQDARPLPDPPGDNPAP